MSHQPSNNTNSTPLCQSDIVMAIERFVMEIMRCDHNGVLRTPEIEFWYYTQLLGSLPRYLSVYSLCHEYSEHIEAFWIGCDAAGLLPEHAHFGKVDYAMDRLNLDSACLLVETIAHYTKTVDFTRRAGDRYYQTQAKNQGLSAYVELVLNRYARTLVVRVDLKYSLETKHLVGIDDVFDHRDAFKRLMATHPLFNALTGYVCTHEQGGKHGGYHIHATFFYNGHERRAGQFIGQQIGELWEQMTDGLGSYFNCNSSEHTKGYRANGTLGVDMILRKNSIECANCVRTVGYLAKPGKVEQYLRIKPLGRRCFVRGSSPRAK